MGDLVYAEGPSGLVVAHQGSDERTAARALREHDRDLRLVPPGVLVQGEHSIRSDAYRVYKYVGSDRPIRFVCGWWDEYGKPYPLSATGLLEMVRRLDLNSRVPVVDADHANRELVAQRQADAAADFEAIADEYRDRLDGKKQTVLPRGRDLQLARNRVRRRTKTREWQP